MSGALRLVAKQAYEPGTASNDSMLIFRLAELRAAQEEVALLETEISRLARIYADKRGLTVRPRIEQLRLELGLS